MEQLWFLYAILRLIEVNICDKLFRNSPIQYKVKPGQKTTYVKRQGSITAYIVATKSWFLYVTLIFTAVKICVKCFLKSPHPVQKFSPHEQV